MGGRAYALRVGAKDATVERVAGEVVLRYERWYPHRAARVWSALTEPDELACWLAAAAIDLSVGGEVMLHWLTGDDEGGEAILHGAITALTAPAPPSETSRTALLEYATDVHGVLRWELRREADGTLLAFTETNAVAGDFLLKVIAGWHLHLDHLEDHLDGSAVDWESWTPHTRARGSGLSWSDHYTRYASRLT